MRKASIVVLTVLLSGAALWFAQVNQLDTNMAGRTIIAGNVVVNGSSFGVDQAALLQGALAVVEGELHLRRLPDGKVALEGNLDVRRSLSN